MHIISFLRIIYVRLLTVFYDILRYENDCIFALYVRVFAFSIFYEKIRKAAEWLVGRSDFNFFHIFKNNDPSLAKITSSMAWGIFKQTPEIHFSVIILNF